MKLRGIKEQAEKVPRAFGVHKKKRFVLRFPPQELRAIVNLIKRGKQMRPKVRYSTKSFVIREGTRQFVRQQNRLLDKAEAGTLHAKQRKHKVV